MDRRHVYPALVALVASFAAVAGPARSDDPAPTQVLPNMRQLAPANLQLAEVGGQWQLGFASEVADDGPGYLQVTGNGPGNAPMVADQIIQMSDGTTTTIPAIGEMHYVIGGGHEHWHLLDFERYELRTAADPSTPIVKDQKTGFCLADAFTSDLCGRNHPELTTVSEGIAVGGSDRYLGYLEGQYLVIDPVTVPDGDYLLDNRVNPTAALLETNSADDVATDRLTIKWDVSGTPTMKITNVCTGTLDCPAPPPDPTPPPPDPQRQPPPDPQPSTAPGTYSGPGDVTPAPEPQAVPIVPPTAFAANDRAAMSRSTAGRLVRHAIAKSLRQEPRRLQLTCHRHTRISYSCASAWQDSRRAQWNGRVSVWYRVDQGELSWFYNLTALNRRDGRSVVARAEQGTAGRAVFASSTGALLCSAAVTAAEH